MRLIKDKKNKMTLKKGLLLAGLTGASIALLSQPALAAQKGKKYHEEEWKKTKTYGNTLIAEDSTSSWGPWKEFIQPAAGPLAIAPMPGMRADGAGYYRPESVDEFSPKYTLVDGADICRAGEWCGYMAYSSYEYYEGDGGEGGDGVEGGPFPGLIGLSLMPDDPDDPSDVDGKVAYRVANLYNPGTVVHDSGEIPVEFWGLPNFNGEENYEGWYNWIEGEYPVEYNEDGQSSAGWAWQSTYNEGYDGDYYWYSDTGFGGPFVAGITTPLSEMAAFNAGNVEASYYGYTPHFGTPVQIDVSFGPATWSGSWNNGVDGSDTYEYTDSSGIRYIAGDVGFNATGTITGSNIQSTSVSAGDGTVTGTVVGSFFGTGAEVLGGVSDIIKSTDSYNAVRNVDTFVTCAGEPCRGVDR